MDFNRPFTIILSTGARHSSQQHSVQYRTAGSDVVDDVDEVDDVDVVDVVDIVVDVDDVDDVANVDDDYFYEINDA